MVPRKFWKAAAVICAFLALGALCGFALPVPEEWPARDPGFSIHVPSAPTQKLEDGIVTVRPPAAERPLSEGDVTILPADPWPTPEEPLTAVFLT